MSQVPTETVEAPVSVIAGANIHRYRVDRYPMLSQETLAQQAGVSAESLRLLEGNRHRRHQCHTQLDTLEKLATALGIEPWQLLYCDQRTLEHMGRWFWSARPHGPLR